MKRKTEMKKFLLNYKGNKYKADTLIGIVSANACTASNHPLNVRHAQCVHSG